MRAAQLIHRCSHLNMCLLADNELQCIFSSYHWLPLCDHECERSLIILSTKEPNDRVVSASLTP